MLSDIECITKSLRTSSDLTDVVMLAVPELVCTMSDMTEMNDPDESALCRSGVGDVLVSVLSSGLPIALAGDAWRTLMLEVHRMHIELDDAYIREVMQSLTETVSGKIGRVVGVSSAGRTVLVREMDLVKTYTMIIEIYTSKEDIEYANY